MGARQSNSSKREAKEKVHNSSQSSSMVEAIKPDCMKKRKTKKNLRRELQSPNKILVNNNRKVQKLTLEDWLLGSPGPSGLHSDCFSEGELYVFKQFSRRIHPSSLSTTAASGSSFSRSRGGKLKKVSFRLPQETDIVIFYSPIETLDSDHE